MASLLGLFFLNLFLVEAELAALNGDQDVGVLTRGRHEFSHDVLGVAACAHAQRLETLQTVLVVNVQLFEGEASVLDEISEKRCILHWFDDILTIWEVLNGDTCTESQIY